MKRKKMLLSMMLMAAMIVGMLPATALAAENEPAEIAVQAADVHSHPVCGSNCADDQSHTPINFDKVLSDTNHRLTIDGTEVTLDTDGKYVLPAGNYYLTDKLELGADGKGITTQGEVNICLNNNVISMCSIGDVITVGENSTLTLTDCGGNGYICHSTTNYLGRGVYVKGTFNMYRGKISNNKIAFKSGVYEGIDGAGVQVVESGTFNMYGGEISENSAASMSGGVFVVGTFNMYDGRISNNTADYFGGGVSVYGGTFNMYGGEISKNSVRNASRDSHGGGGVWMHSGSTFCMSGGSITGNTACRDGRYGQGGGIHCADTNVKVELFGTPVIKDNGLTTGAVNNLYADTGSSNVTITGSLTTGAEIHIVKNGDNAAKVASGVAASDANQYIFCDDTGYEASYNADSNMITWTVPTHTHVWGEWFSNGDGTHTRTCRDNPDHTQTEKCSGGTATCKDKAVCTICNTAYGELNPANHVGGMEVRNYVAATTEAAGYTGDTWCKGCNTKIADGTTIPKLNSSSDDDDDDTPAVSDSGNNTSAGAAASPVIEDYTIKRGDTLGAIAKKYGCTVAELVAANSDLIKNPNRIYAGWKLKIPQKGATATANQPDNKTAGVYTIKRGDSLWAIARRYGCTVADIVKLNSNLITMPDRIRVGWQLNMPVK